MFFSIGHLCRKYSRFTLEIARARGVTIVCIEYTASTAVDKYSPRSCVRDIDFLTNGVG